MRFQDFEVHQPAQYPTSGTYESSVYDAGRTPTWDKLEWSSTTPGGTSVELQLASSNSPNGPWSFVGPTGSGSFYTSSGTSIPASGAGAITGRYLRYRAVLAGSGSNTPLLHSVTARLLANRLRLRSGGQSQDHPAPGCLGDLAGGAR